MVHSVPFVLVELEPDVDPFHPSPVRGPGRERACPVANQAAADQHAAGVLRIIRQIKRAGARTLREIANALNERGSERRVAGNGTRPRSTMCWRAPKPACCCYKSMLHQERDAVRKRLEIQHLSDNLAECSGTPHLLGPWGSAGLGAVRVASS